MGYRAVEVYGEGRTLALDPPPWKVLHFTYQGQYPDRWCLEQWGPRDSEEVAAQEKRFRVKRRLTFILGSIALPTTLGCLAALLLGGPRGIPFLLALAVGFASSFLYSWARGGLEEARELTQEDIKVWRGRTTISPAVATPLKSLFTKLEEAGNRESHERLGFIYLEMHHQGRPEKEVVAWLDLADRIIELDPTYPLHLLPQGLPRMEVILKHLEVKEAGKRMAQEAYEASLKAAEVKALQSLREEAHRLQEAEDISRMAGAEAYLQAHLPEVPSPL